MPSLSRTRTFFTAFFALCFGITLCPSIHAQTTVPNAFVDGQRHYIFGGFNGSALNADLVMIDLTVSWNTSSPAVEKLPNSDATAFAGSATLLPNGNIFTLSFGNGYIYDIRTSSWKLEMTKLPIGFWYVAVADMETGLIYVPDIGLRNVTNRVMLEVDLKTKTITKKESTPGPSLVSLAFGAWSAPLRSILFIAKITNMLYTYTPSKVNGTSDGWGTMETTGDLLPTNVSRIVCFVPAHNGSTMVLMVGDEQYRMTVYVLDVETRTWKSGPLYSVTIDYATYACSVSGDQLISFGPVIENGTASQNSVSVYNMKTEKWVTTYTPPPQPTSTSLTHPDMSSDNTDDHSNEKVIIIIVIVTGVLLTIILIAITAYIGATKRSKSRGRGTGSDGLPDSPDIRSDVTAPGKVVSKGILGLHNSVDVGINLKQETPDLATKLRRNVFGMLGRLHSIRAQEDTRHPHAIVEKSAIERNAQEEPPGNRSISQYLQADSMDAISHHPHKEELIDSTMHDMEEPRSTAAIHNDKADWNEK
ncbi:hypothetical protein BGX31_006409 [Mortierella sp. GBA43]|nr:hypothetical protein BGX31_006409 [Mortierella sp. GBA43]